MGAATTDVNYRVAFTRSPLAVAFIAAAGTATIALALAVTGDPLVELAVVASISWAALDSCRRIALRAGRRGVKEIVVRGGEIEVRCDGGGFRRGEVRGGSFVAPFLTVIRWRPHAALFDRTVVVLPDMLPPDDFRRLRVHLRWIKPGTDPSFRRQEP